MKVKLKHMLKGYSGTCDGMVYYYDPKVGKMLCRRWVKPRTTPQNKELCTSMQNLQRLMPSEGFKQDLRYYLAFLADEGKKLSWQNLFVKMMYALKRDYGVDLRSLSREDIIEQDLPCQSVARAVDAGLLPRVSYYERLTNSI